MEIEYSKNSLKFISTQDRTTKQRLKKGIEGLTEAPPQGDIKTLQGYSIKTFRLRVGQYRVIYRYCTVRKKCTEDADCTDGNEQTVLYIADIDSRGGIYK